MSEHDEAAAPEEAASASQPREQDADNARPESIERPSEEKPAGQRDRIRELIREKHAAEALANRNIADAGALRERLQDPGRAQDYRAPEDYTRAVAENAVRAAGADILARQAGQAQELAARAANQAWAEATASFRQTVPDFDAVAHNPSLPVTPVMADAIRECERGPEVAYWLGKNPQEAARIAALPPVAQATAIARLESRTGAGAAPASKAPPPFTALSGRGGSAGKSFEDMSFEEYRKARGF